MLLYILLDLNMQAWHKTEEEDPINNLQVFINAFLLCSIDNIVRIVNSKVVIFDSQKDFDLSPVFLYASQSDSSRITPGDLGFALMDLPSAVLIFEMSEGNPDDHLEYIKCMSVAQMHQIPIYGVSNSNNMLVRMCCDGSGGKYLESYKLSELLQLLGSTGKGKSAYRITCFCCKNIVKVGLVCPICLSIFCKFTPVCKKCKTKFSFIK
ncbi:General transcription factor IIH subunit 3 [Glugoides intestinalis]